MVTKGYDSWCFCQRDWSLPQSLPLYLYPTPQRGVFHSAVSVTANRFILCDSGEWGGSGLRKVQYVGAVSCGAGSGILLPPSGQKAPKHLCSFNKEKAKWFSYHLKLKRFRCHYCPLNLLFPILVGILTFNSYELCFSSSIAVHAPNRERIYET